MLVLWGWRWRCWWLQCHCKAAGNPSFIFVLKYLGMLRLPLKELEMDGAGPFPPLRFFAALRVHQPTKSWFLLLFVPPGVPVQPGTCSCTSTEGTFCSFPPRTAKFLKKSKLPVQKH